MRACHHQRAECTPPTTLTQIFETIYYASLRTSCRLAKVQGTYETYEGCPVSKGILQPDMWGVKVGEIKLA